MLGPEIEKRVARLVEATLSMRRLLVLLAVCLAPLLPVEAQGEIGTYGTAGKTYLSLSASDFRPFESEQTFQINQTAIGRTISGTSGNPFVQAPLHLPSGALVTEIEAVVCDTHPSFDLVVKLFVQPRMALPLVVDGPRSLGEPGCVDITVVLGTPVRIDNNANSYWLEINLMPDTSLQLASVRVGYRLQVSPAPATARFNDVPTNHPFFPFIEALAAAGITGGCSVSPSLYCPDGVVTREQMAAFIARALGLHFVP